MSTLTLDVDLVLLKFSILLEESLFCVNTREYICTLVELLSAYEKVKPNRIHHTVKIYMFALVFFWGDLWTNLKYHPFTPSSYHLLNIANFYGETEQFLNWFSIRVNAFLTSSNITYNHRLFPRSVMQRKQLQPDVPEIFNT